MMSTPPVLDIIAATVPPEGVSYQWNTLSLFDVEQPIYMEFMQAQGWRFVPPERHPDLPSEDGKIVYQGSVLMERDAADTAEAMAEETDRAAVDLARAEQNRVGNEPNDFHEGDEVWDGRYALLLGVAGPKHGGNQFEIRTTFGLVVSSGSGERANPWLNLPKQEDMFKTRAEAEGRQSEYARAAIRAEAERVAFNTDGDVDEIERELLSWMDGGYNPPPKVEEPPDGSSN
jgi:hypothetical protein